MNDNTFEVQDFEAEVLEASHDKPVLVDFWAPWCGPCRVLGPVLEKLAAEPDAGWTLVKVNTDANPDLADAFQIRGIPAVKLFVDGAVADEFTGALPEYAVRQWLEKALPSEGKKLLERAQMELAAGNEPSARRLLEAVLASEPNSPEARVLMARLVLFDDPAQAAGLASGTAAFAGPGFVQTEEAVLTLAPLLQRDPATLPEGQGKEPFRAALAALQARDFDTALARFIEVIQTDRYYDDDGARKASIALFNLLGPEDPLTLKYRRRFDMYLY